MAMLSDTHVLVLEDEYFLADELVTALERDHAVVVGPFASRSDAEKALQETRVDIAILNVRVRDGTTYPIAKLLRSRGIPFIFATGQEVRGEPPEWHDAPWISKPYSPADILRLLATTLHQA